MNRANEGAEIVTPLNINAVLDSLSEEWAPQVVATVNDYDVKIAAVDGEFASHVHDDTDEFFLILAGTFELCLEDGRVVTLEQGDVFTVPRGIRHAPRAAPGTRILMVEPRGTVNNGDPATGTAGKRLV